MNKGILLYLCLWILAFVLYFVTKNVYLLWIPYIFFIINELIYILFGWDILSSNERTALFYDLSSWYTHYAGIDHNYSEGYYPNNDFSITSREAEHNKFALFLKLLGAKSGDKILNMGSGTCSFEKYCKERGIEMVATSLSSEQIDYCKQHGIESYHQDYTVFNPNFVNRFDYVTMIGSTEHMYTGGISKMSSYEKKHEEMTEFFKLITKYLKPNGRILYSGLHIHPDYINSFGAYIMERTYGSTPNLNTNELNAASSAKHAGYEVIYQEDATKHYYMATVLDDNHFGTPNTPWSLASIGLFILGFIYPPAWHILIYGIFGYWMWMFDGRVHFSFWKRYSLAPEEKRPLSLKWYVFQK